QIKGSFATLSTTEDYPLSSLGDFSQSDAKDGTLIFLFADVSRLSKNLNQKPLGSFLLAVNNCSILDYGNLPYDPLACPRASFSGQFRRLETSLDATNRDYMAFIEK